MHSKTVGWDGGRPGSLAEVPHWVEQETGALTERTDPLDRHRWVRGFAQLKWAVLRSRYPSSGGVPRRPLTGLDLKPGWPVGTAARELSRGSSRTGRRPVRRPRSPDLGGSPLPGSRVRVGVGTRWWHSGLGRRRPCARSRRSVLRVFRLEE